MSSNRMPSPAKFRCPVCHARQELQAQCRRCQADLTRVVGAYRRLEHLLQQRSEALDTDDAARQRELDREIQLLSPGCLGE
jgi:uncharacterized protein YpiB (UPF0302 family)